MTTLAEKIQKILAEGAVPGTDSTLGVKKQDPESLKLDDMGPDHTSGEADTAKITAKAGGKAGEKLADPSIKSDAADPKAEADTKKIKAKANAKPMEKLSATAEHMNVLFDGETLSEEFKTKAEAIFEAAVNQVAEEKIEALKEEYQVQLDEAVEEAKGELVEQIDGYLDHVVEQWMTDNAVALESGIKVEMVSSFMDNMKRVFEEHYIDVPDSKIDVVQEQATKIEEMESEIEALQEAATQAQNDVRILKCEAIIAEHTDGLTSIESEKLYALAENVEFDTEEEFASKVKALKESYFRKASTTEDTAKQDEGSGEISEEKVHNDVQAVLKALHQGNKLIRSSN